MALKKYCLFNSADDEIYSIEDHDGSVSEANVLIEVQTEVTGITLDIFEVAPTQALQEVDAHFYKVNAIGTNFEAKTALEQGEDDPEYADPSPEIPTINYYQWMYCNDATVETNLSQTSLDSFPVTGNTSIQSFLKTNWVEELVDAGNSEVPDGTVYNTEEVFYFAREAETVRFDAVVAPRESSNSSFVTGSNIFVKARFKVIENGTSTVIYIGPEQPLAVLDETGLARMSHSDSFIVNFELNTEYRIQLVTRAFHSGGTTSTLGIATEYFKLHRTKLT